MLEHSIKDNRTTAPTNRMREKIEALEQTMLRMPEYQIEFPVKHHFSPGIYMRELFIPAGATLTGKIHKTEHLNILAQGEMTVWTEDGMKRLKASTVIASKPGIKRAGFAHADSVWITVHPNSDNVKDVLAIEERLVANTYAEFLNYVEQRKLGAGG